MESERLVQGNPASRIEENITPILRYFLGGIGQSRPEEAMFKDTGERRERGESVHPVNRCKVFQGIFQKTIELWQADPRPSAKTSHMYTGEAWISLAPGIHSRKTGLSHAWLFTARCCFLVLGKCWECFPTKCRVP